MKSEQELEWLLARREREWMDGASAAPVIELMLEMGRTTEAAAVGRLALTMPGEPAELARIEELLAGIESTPAGWDSAIKDFADNPSDDSWRSIIRFAPDDRVYDWTEKAVRQLKEIGCDPNAIIRFASQTGVTPGMIALVEEGGVEADVLAARASQQGAASAFWLGLAAQASYRQGDRFRAVSLLRDAFSHESGLSTAIGSVFWLRENGDEEMHDLMKGAGVWEMPR